MSNHCAFLGPRGPIILGVFATLCVSAPHAPADELITFHSGNGSVGEDDARITYLLGPVNAPFPSTFTEGDFTAVAAGPAARIVPNSAPECVTNLLENPDAKWVTPQITDPETTALYAIQFVVSETSIISASLDIRFRVDDQLGGGPNQGVYLNGTAVSGVSSGGECEAVAPNRIYREDIGPLLHTGTNFLYLNVTRTDSYEFAGSGILFTADVRIDSDGAEVFRVDDDAPSGGDGASWATALNDLQDALDAAEASGDPNREIWLAEGIYRPSKRLDSVEPRSATFVLVSEVTIYGGFQGTETDRNQRDPEVHASVLHGDLAGNDLIGPTSPTWAENAHHVVVVPGYFTNLGAALDGVSITHGNANGAWNSFEGRGGGMYVGADGVLFRRCTILENAGTNVAGVLLNASATFDQCTFLLNEPSAIQTNSASGELELTGCRFEGNRSQRGGAIFALGCSAFPCAAPLRIHAVDSTFTGNVGTNDGGVFLYRA